MTGIFTVEYRNVPLRSGKERVICEVRLADIVIAKGTCADTPIETAALRNRLLKEATEKVPALIGAVAGVPHIDVPECCPECGEKDLYISGWSMVSGSYSTQPDLYAFDWGQPSTEFIAVQYVCCNKCDWEIGAE